MHTSSKHQLVLHQPKREVKRSSVYWADLRNEPALQASFCSTGCMLNSVIQDCSSS